MAERRTLRAWFAAEVSGPLDAMYDHIDATIAGDPPEPAAPPRSTDDPTRPPG
ncbi:hypothetical protein [Cryobacterium frigoriphilum]|uniref:hypothetical protein n=1 Tax=Cryobacterium frigoriphilum TaxID=1259150 RepID=UPI00141B96F2|nr:hypothetical protein [Cryobacterium frigoriphilum]